MGIIGVYHSGYRNVIIHSTFKDIFGRSSPATKVGHQPSEGGGGEVWKHPSHGDGHFQCWPG